MKRSMILAAALSLALLCLSGCDQPVQGETPAPQQSAPSQNQPIDPVPPQEEQPAPVEAPQEEPLNEEPPYEMPSGVWLAGTDVGYSNYYYFNPEERSGNYVSLEYGLGMPFSYGGSGNELIFHLEGHETDKSATVEHIDEGTFTLIWEDSLPETLTFVSEGTLEDFHFYSNNDLALLALDHYAEDNGSAPSQAGAMTNEDNTVTVQLYDNLGDHNSTAAWYIFDRFTATGTDLLTGEEIDLLEEEAPVEETPAVEDTPAEEPPKVEDVPAAEDTLPETSDEAAAVPEAVIT